MKRLIVDMDDVLADTCARILEVFNERNDLDLTKEFFEDKEFYPYVKQPGYVSYRDALDQPGFFRNLSVMPDSQEVLKELAEKYEIFVVSAALEFPNSLREKYDWLEEYFPFITWKNLVLCGDKRVVHGDVMIDDHSRNFEYFGGMKLLYHTMQNTQETGHRRVRSWKEIYQILK